MKKKLIIAALMLTAAGSSFGQGFFAFGAAAKFVWDDFTSPAQNAVTANGNVKVAFLWAPTNGFPTLSGLSTTGNPTNDPSLSIASPWASLLSGSDAFSLATNVSGGTLAAVNNGSGALRGNISYNSQNAFGVLGTVAGNFYSIVILGWDATYADPFTAAAAGAAVGYSDVFVYASGVTASATTAGPPPAVFGTAGATAFGVSPVIPIPEPTTFALAGLGAAAMLIFRKRKE